MISHWKQKAQSLSIEFLLMLLLLFWIPMESTLLGRSYNYVVGLNSANLSVDMSTVYIQWILLFTVLAPMVIAALSKPAGFKHGTMFIVRVGLISWVIGACVSALAHISDPQVILNTAAATLSAGMVFFAVRRVNMWNVRHYELACRAILFGGLIPCVIDLYRYHAAFGIPSLQGVIINKYKPGFWSEQCYFGNPDNASGAYGLFAMLALGVLFCKLFDRSTRRLALIMAVLSSLEVLLSMARTGIVFLGIAIGVAVIFTRSKKAIVTFGVLTVAILLMKPEEAGRTLLQYFQPAVGYDARDSNTAARIESIEEGWRAFLDHPLIGVGTGRTGGVVDEDVPHELAVWQATEHGIFGLMGVLLIMGACLWRFGSLLWAGAKSYALRLEFGFFLAPGLYFIRGLVSNAAVSNSVFNTWICLTFAMLAIIDKAGFPEPIESVKAAPVYSPVDEIGLGELCR